MKAFMKKRDISNVLYEVVSFIRFVVFCWLVIILLFSFVFHHETVRGTSMYPNLKEGENVYINIAASYLKKIQRFDVVVAKSHHSKDLWVKRVVGLPGEVIEYRDDILYVNGKKVKEPFLDKTYVENVKEQRHLLNFTRNYKAKRLKGNEYLLVGDNRVDSLDSRSESVGPFKRNQIIANGLFIVTPLSEMRYVGNGG